MDASAHLARHLIFEALPRLLSTKRSRRGARKVAKTIWRVVALLDKMLDDELKTGPQILYRLDRNLFFGQDAARCA
ncbi:MULTISPECIES: hypothetical protein [unclassified Rhizobium]|uniref:hypothetical protein n=1 Tax=unclassified Rhizobium TaxID=2613769 RepID=UPI0013C4A9FD|nr:MULTISPECIES: hypothetical protein [unclassified Rhizobium]